MEFIGTHITMIVQKHFAYRATARYSSLLSRGLSTYENEEEPQVRQRVALVLGSSGCLGSAVAQHFKNNMGIKTVGADVISLPDDTRTSLDSFIKMPTFDHPAAVADLTRALVEGLAGVLDEGEELDAIICANGGWMGDPKLPTLGGADEDFLAGIKEYGDTINKMLEMNLFPVIAAGFAANKFMADNGLFVAIGATPALSATPGMLAYGLSKVGTHHFVQTLGEMTGKAMTTRTKRQKARRLRKDSQYLDTLSVIGVLPTTIDTPSNRTAMPEADFADWTKPTDIAKEIGFWVNTPQLRPHSGSLVKVHPAKDRGATFTVIR